MKTRLTFVFLFTCAIVFAQNGQKSLNAAIDLMKNQDNTAYFEVSPEMFQMLSEVDEASPEFKTYVSKLSRLKMIQSRSSSNDSFDLYETFMTNVNLKDFSMLMTSNEPNNKLSFYKRENGNSDNEFLLVNSRSIIYITGKLDLKSIGEFDRIMNIAGSAFDM